MRSYLVVDDNQAFADNLAEILADAGARVDVAIGGAAALEAVRSRRYDAMLSDMRMPLMSGAELVDRVRRIDPGLPAIVITAYTRDDDLAAARRAGLLAVLPKPAPMGRLLELCALARRRGLVALLDGDAPVSDEMSERLRSRGFTVVVGFPTRPDDARPFVGLIDLGAGAMGRVEERYPDLPIVVVTGHPRDEILSRVEKLYAERRD